MRTLSRRRTTSVHASGLSLSLTAALVASAGVAAAASPEPASGELPEPYGPARNGAIAYSKDGDIWTVDSAVQHPSVLVSGPAVDTYPLYSPDGTRLVFERREEGQPARVMVADAEGTDIEPIADIRADWWWSDWSPDSRSLLVVWSVDGGMVMEILSTDGTGSSTIVDIGPLTPTFAAWRPPEGREIVFVSQAEPGSTDLNVYAVAPDGSGLRTIGDDGNAEAFQQPDLSPDGRSIVYWNWEPGTIMHERDLDTGVTTTLDDPVAFPGAGTGPVLSPDGTGLVYDTSADPGTGDAQLVRGSLDGQEPGSRIGEPYDYGEWTDIWWDFSPDGATVLLNWSVADTQEALNATGENHLIDAATGVAVVADEWMFGPSWQRMAP